jgi:hypothetical protein
MSPLVSLKGGDKLQAFMRDLAQRIPGSAEVRVGFLSGSTEADGTSLPMVAAVQEFGGRIEREPSTVTIYRRVSAAGDFLRGGRFVKRKASNFASTHYVGAHVITIPPRPYFRNMIAKHKDAWGGQLGALLKAKNFNATTALKQMGALIKGQLQQSIVDTNSPPLAASTIRRKSRGRVNKIAGVLGPAKPLVETGTMLNSVDYEVTTKE